MKLRETRQGEIHVFHLQGDVDMHHAAALRALFSAKSDRNCPALILDFSGVNFIDSTGIAVLLEYLRDSKSYGGSFCVTGLTERVRHIFEVVALDQVMSVFPTIAAAASVLSAGNIPALPRQLFDADYQPTLAATA